MRNRASAAEEKVMERCEGYYRLENRRCDRSATRDVRAKDGHYYLVCDYHARQTWTASVARWSGESDVRASSPTGLVAQPAPAS